MQVKIGLNLDGYLLPAGPLAGSMTVGPAGLLSLLETRLGLAGHWPSHALRLARYRRCLAQADDGQRFYSRSLAADPISTAQTLLTWRDHWIEAGWNGQAAATASSRLQAMAAVEYEARSVVADGLGDRLRRVAAAVQHCHPGIEALILLDRPQDFSPVWQTVFAALPTRIELAQRAPTAPSGTDLHRLQQALCDQRPVSLTQDGTVLALSGPPTTLAAAVVRLLRNDASAGIVAQDNGHLLDSAWRELDLPAAGSARPSRWRPPLQVLALAIALLWSPLDPHALLEFLTHPVCPLPRRLRRPLADAVAEKPGMGSDLWHQKITQVCAEELVAHGVDAAAALRQALADWLPVQRFSPENGVPPTVLEAIARRTQDWSARQASRPDLPTGEQALWLAAQAQAQEAAAVFAELAAAGYPTLPQVQVERLLDEVTGRGVPAADCVAAVGGIPLHPLPDQALLAREQWLWWWFVQPPLPLRLPWSDEEIHQLAGQGAMLTAPASAAARLQQVWLRPLLATRRRLILAIPTLPAQATPRSHPLWERLQVLTNASLRLQAVDALDPADPLALGTQSVTALPLAQRRRWWQLPDTTALPTRSTESYSSLQTFLFSPYDWVLQHQAALYRGNLLVITADNQQRGRLAHRLIQQLFASSTLDWRSAADPTVNRWLEQSWPTLLEQEGANWLLPGMIAQREDLLATLQRAVCGLLRHLRQAGVVQVLMESTAAGRFCGGQLNGTIDLLATLADGREAVLDLKWGGGQYRREELATGQYLQLAVYARLRQQATGHWPALAYFILSENRLLAPDTACFPHAEACHPQPPDGVALWQSIETAWQWRRDQLHQGLIEVPVTGTTPDEQSQPPAASFPVPATHDRYTHFGILSGRQEP